MKQSLFIFTLLLSTISATGQSCNCLENFDFLKEKIENDYAGFNDKVNELTKTRYENLTNYYRDKALETNTTKRCELLMEEWLKFFQDKHLSISVELNIYWTFKAIDSNALLFRIPDFSWSSKTIIDSLIRTNYDLITNTPILIIDLRGNGGGIDYSFMELLPFLYTHPYESKGVEWFASKGNIKHFEDAQKNGNIRKGYEQDTQDHIRIMKENQNSFVSIEDNEIFKLDSVLPYPQLIGLIVNDFCASSCEEFVLMAKNSSKTIVFGTNTLGVLDYSNTVPLSLPMKGMSLRYPMTRSQRLPENPIDNIGIEPDVRIDLPDNLDLKSNIDEWVLFVKQYLENELEMNCRVGKGESHPQASRRTVRDTLASYGSS